MRPESASQACQMIWEMLKSIPKTESDHIISHYSDIWQQIVDHLFNDEIRPSATVWARLWDMWRMTCIIKNRIQAEMN